MKKNIYSKVGLIIALLLCLSSIAYAQTTDVDKTTRYKYIDGTIDVINGYSSLSHSNWDQHAQFHGMGFLKAKPLPYSTGAFSSNKITTTMWVNTDTVTEQQDLLSKSDDNSTYGDDGSSWGYKQYINGSGYLCTQINSNSTAFYAECATDYAIDDNADHSIVIYYNLSTTGGDLRIYLDGVESNTSSFNSGISWAEVFGGFATDVYLGATQNGNTYSNPYKGKMDDVVIYYIELDVTDASSYHAFGMGAGTPLSFFRMAEWDFDLKIGDDNWDNADLETNGFVTYNPDTTKVSIAQDAWSLLQFNFDDNITAYDGVSVNNGSYLGDVYATVNPYNSDLGNSIFLDGGGDYIIIDRKINLSRDYFSYNAIFSVEGTITDRQPLAWSADTLGLNHAFMIDVINEKIEVSLFNESGSRTRFYTTTNVTANALHNVGVYYNSTHLSIFLDGNLENYTAYTETLNDEAINIYYGLVVDSGVFFLDGILDDVYITNVEATPNYHFALLGESQTNHNDYADSILRDVKLNTTLNFMNVTLLNYSLPLNSTLDVKYRQWNLSQGYNDVQPWDQIWQHFDGNSTQYGSLSGNTVLSGGAVTTAEGQYNKALYCDGVDDSVFLNYSYLPSTGSIIMYLTPVSSDEGTFFQWGDNMTLRINSGGYYELNLSTQYGSAIVTSDTASQVGRRDHLVFNYGSPPTGNGIYLNGKQVARSNDFPIPSFASATTGSLCADTSGLDPINVIIDEFVLKSTSTNENNAQQFLTGTFVNFGSWSNYQSFTGSPLLLAQNDSENIQFGINISSSGNGGSNHYTSSFRSLRVGEYINDTQAPTIQSLTESPTDPLTYIPDINLTFTANVTDDYNLTLVNFTINGSTYTPTQSGDIFTTIIPVLPVGVYSYMWSGEDWQGNLATQNGTYTISENSSYLSISISPNATVVQTTETTIEGLGCPFELTCNLFRDGILVSNPDEQALDAGIYLYVYNTTGNGNFTNQSVNATLNVTPIDLTQYPICSLVSGVNMAFYGDVNIPTMTPSGVPCVQLVFSNFTSCGNITATIFNTNSSDSLTQTTQDFGIFCGLLFTQTDLAQYVFSYDGLAESQSLIIKENVIDLTLVETLYPFIIILIGILLLVTGEYIGNHYLYIASGVWFIVNALLGNIIYNLGFVELVFYALLGVVILWHGISLVIRDAKNIY